MLQVAGARIAGAARVVGVRRLSVAAVARKKTVTHTGQSFDEDDQRNLRFMGGKSMEINKKWAGKLINQVPPTATEERVVSCDGGGGALGHPKVYINLDPGTAANCGYCGLRFFLEPHH
eukprot:m.411707 g.411707  ORF g.411707 m.411707 type:complete len:119 (-) comp28722_c0_seq1:448-804(-)